MNIQLKKHIQEKLKEELEKNHCRIGVAESCTGGLMGAFLTDIAGSSSYFSGGYLVYTNHLKEKLLGVKHSTLESHGAVSQECVHEMCNGLRESLGVEIGIAISGIAGPTGGNSKKPVGTVWMALHTPWKKEAFSEVFSGNRQQIREKSVLYIAEKLLLSLEKQTAKKKN
jgi:nicotinamide-nucleotide amidase